MGKKHKYEDYPDYHDFNLYDVELREKRFVEKLCKVLPEVCYEYFPELKTYRQIITPVLTKYIETIGEDANHFFMVVNYQVKYNLAYSVTPLPQKRTVDDLKKDIDKFFKACENQEIHCKCSILKDCKRIHDKRIFFDNFKWLLHKKIKEIMVEFYTRLFDFSSYGLRQMDSLLYWECVDRVFYQGFLEVSETLFEERFPDVVLEPDPEYLEEELLKLEGQLLK